MKNRIYYCKEKDCNNEITYKTFKYGKSRCKKCAGKIHSEWMKLNNPKFYSNYKPTTEHKSRISQTRLRNKLAQGKNNPNYKDGRTKRREKCKNCPKIINIYQNKSGLCKKCSSKLLFSDLNFRKKLLKNSIKAMKKVFKSKEYCDKLRKSTKNLWKNKNYREKVVKAILKSSRIKPNKKEKLLNELLQKVLPNEYEFVGDGKIILGGLCPDFVNVNGQKKLIELYGDYWHNLPDKKKIDEQRLVVYEAYGYKTLIIWEHELKDLNKVKTKILEFNRAVGKT